MSFEARRSKPILFTGLILLAGLATLSGARPSTAEADPLLNVPFGDAQGHIFQVVFAGVNDCQLFIRTEALFFWYGNLFFAAEVIGSNAALSFGYIVWCAPRHNLTPVDASTRTDV